LSFNLGIADNCYHGQHSKALKSWDIEVISETGITEGKGHVWQGIANESEILLFEKLITQDLTSTLP
jgi:hypothetical protein